MATTPNPKGSPMNTLTLVIVAIASGDFKTAQTLVAKYRDANGGSNRANWSRITNVLSAVLTVERTGKPVEVTEFYAGETGKSPAYNIVHRQLSAGVIRPHWKNVQVVAVMGAKTSGKSITGTPDSRATFAEGARVFICPVE